MSFGNTVGRAIGASGAYVGHAAVVSFKATGRFGEDVLTGTRDGYRDNAQRLAAQRALAYAAWTPPASIAIKTRKATAKA